MRVALLHNASAGNEDHDGAELERAIEKGGHQLLHRVSRVGELTEALHADPCDLVVVAGGDGTVGRAACELSGWNVPISILPTGTANNTAHCLNLPTDHQVAIRDWPRASPQPFDLGLLSDGAVKRRFAEAIGWGVFPSVIAQAKQNGPRSSVERTLKRDRKLFRSVVRSTTPQDYRIEVDGRDVSGSYLLVEIMNVPLLGAQLSISPQSHWADGVFELVLAEARHAPTLKQLSREGRVLDALSLRVERGQHFRVETAVPLLHVDGRVWRHAPGTHAYEVSVEAGAVQYLGASQGSTARPS
jgi:diacylglycerol kinase family enzyme